MESVDEFAQRYGYIRASRLDITYNEWDVYSPVSMNPAAMAGAHFILENDDEIRFSLNEESDDIRELLSVLNNAEEDNDEEIEM